MARRVERVPVRDGYDRWSASYDATPNPVVALDRRHTLPALEPRPGERILDAGCGTGAHLRALRHSGCRPVGMDFSRGMLGVARRAAPEAWLVHADLEREFPLRRRVFDAVLSTLVSEHLTELGAFFAEAFAVLRPGGRLVFSAFHPDPARAGVEANFEEAGTEYRLGAEPYTVEDYLGRIEDAGFRALRFREYAPDDELLGALPAAAKYAGRPLLLLIGAERP